jgi:hypothetical protein
LWVVTTKQEVLRRTNLLSSDTTRTACKITPPTILRCHENIFTALLPGNGRRRHTQTHRPTDEHVQEFLGPEIRASSDDWAQLSRFYLKTETESRLRNVVFLNESRTMDNVQKHNICCNYFIVAYILCRGNVFTEPLPSNERMDTYIDTD